MEKHLKPESFDDHFFQSEHSWPGPLSQWGEAPNQEFESRYPERMDGAAKENPCFPWSAHTRF
jgi:hypothetical protein